MRKLSGRIDKKLLKPTIVDLSVERANGQDQVVFVGPVLLQVNTLLENTHQRIDPILFFETQQSVKIAVGILI